MSNKGEREHTKAKRKAIELCRDKQGRVLPEAVVEAARNPRSPLHGEFEWDDKLAAAEQRLERARELIREVRLTVIYDDKKISAPYYVSDPRLRESSYIATSVAAKNEDLAETILMDELRRIEFAVIRARSLAAAFDLVGHFDRMLNDVVEIRGKVASRRGAASSEVTASA